MKNYQLVKRISTSFKHSNPSSADYNTVEKWYMRFKNIKNDLEINTEHPVHISRDILEKLSNSSEIRKTLFKEVDGSIIKKLQTKTTLNNEETDLLCEELTNKKEYLRSYIESNIRECKQKMKAISPIQYYRKEIAWENISIKLILLERGFVLVGWIMEKFV